MRPLEKRCKNATTGRSSSVIRLAERHSGAIRDTRQRLAPLIAFGDDDEAIRIANDTEYGLSAGVITADEERGFAVANRLQTGMAHINDSSVGDEPHVPFGGVKSSGLGRHGGQASIESFTEQRWISLERGGRHYPPPFLEK